MISVGILGSTGSIGKSLIELLKTHKKKYKIIFLSTNKNINELLKQRKLFNVKNLIVTDKKAYEEISKKNKNKNIKIYNNFSSLDLIIKNKIDYIMSAITGIDGLIPTVLSIKRTKKIAIANKESIICAWPIIKKNLNKFNTKFIPVDSEHFSIWSLLNDSKIENDKIKDVYLTASGGPFINLPMKDFKNIKKNDALKHPNWKMGAKITIDSATMMNKVFEVIEAKNIFNLNLKQIKILIHDKSYVHALIKFNNGLIKFLAHEPDMKIPIMNSLNSDLKLNYKNELNLKTLNDLNFRKVDTKRYPITKTLLLIENQTTLFDTVIVTLNDYLVEKFLKNEIRFQDIHKLFFKYINLNEFKKFKKKIPKNTKEIEKLQELVSLKIKSKGI